jgi:hypothetical protein
MPSGTEGSLSDTAVSSGAPTVHRETDFLMAKQRPKPPPVDRAVEYINSPQMIQRLWYGNTTGGWVGVFDDPETTIAASPTQY